MIILIFYEIAMIILEVRHMMNVIWAGMMLAALGCSVFTGRGAEVTAAMFAGAESAVTLTLSLLGTMCLWSGLMQIADRAGITRGIAKLFAPLLRMLFPGLPVNGAAAKAICMNLSANLLGMGNAATPFGLEAMHALAAHQPARGAATDHMVTFVVMNTACFQLIPSTVAALRSNAGSADPFDIMLCTWVASLGTLLCGLTAAWAMKRRNKL
jgi:spore maturation protein A